MRKPTLLRIWVHESITPESIQSSCCQRHGTRQTGFWTECIILPDTKSVVPWIWVPEYGACRFYNEFICFRFQDVDFLKDEVSMQPRYFFRPHFPHGKTTKINAKTENLMSALIKNTNPAIKTANIIRSIALIIGITDTSFLLNDP